MSAGLVCHRGVVLFPAGDSEIIPVGVNQIFLIGDFNQQVGAPTRPPSCPPTAPAAPRSLAAAPTNLSGQIRLTWTVPLSNGGAAITDYIIQRSPTGPAMDDDQRWRADDHWVHGDRSGQWHPLLLPGPGQERRWQLASSNVVNSVPRTVPSAARTLTAVPTNLSGQIRLSWLAPASTGGLAITDYIIQRSPNGTTGWLTINDGVRTTNDVHRHRDWPTGRATTSGCWRGMLLVTRRGRTRPAPSPERLRPRAR